MQLSSILLLLGLSSIVAGRTLPSTARSEEPDALVSRTAPATVKVQPEPEDIIVYAERGYENMMTALKLDNQGNTLADPKKRGNKDDYLMAALYVPGVGVFLCSIPQPAAKKYITANAPVDVPALWGEIKGRTPSGSAHAEDGSAFRYEKSLKKKLAAGAKYPAGSIIRVWGSFKGGKAKQQSLCSTGTSKIDPACDPVFVNLGVGH